MNFDEMRPLPSEYAHLSERTRALFSAKMMFAAIWFEMWVQKKSAIENIDSPKQVAYVRERLDKTGKPSLLLFVSPDPIFDRESVDEGEEETEAGDGWFIPVHQIIYALTDYFPSMQEWSVKTASWTGVLVDHTEPRLVEDLDETAAQQLESLMIQITKVIFPERTVHD